MPAVTDLHLAVRAAVVTALEAAFTPDGEDDPVPPVVAVDKLDDATRVDVDRVVVCCDDAVPDRPDLSSNTQDGFGFPVHVLLMGRGMTGGDRPAGAVEPTEFRRRVRVACHHKRLSGVAQVGWCEVADAGELFDRGAPALDQLRSAVTVTAVGRWPRT